MIAIENLDHIVYLHKLDVAKGLDRFTEKRPHIQFKVVLLDTGTYEVMRACLPHFWPRLINGGVLILDQFNHEIAPGETRAAQGYLLYIPIYSHKGICRKTI